MEYMFKWQTDEMIIVGSVLILIFGISFFQLRTGQMKTRDAQRKADVELVARALRAYKEDHKILPEASESGKLVSCGKNGLFACEWGEGKVVDAQNVVYMEKLPNDPLVSTGRKYVFDGSKIYIALENKNDKGKRDGLTIDCGNGLQCNWYVEI